MLVLCIIQLRLTSLINGKLEFIKSIFRLVVEGLFCCDVVVGGGIIYSSDFVALCKDLRLFPFFSVKKLLSDSTRAPKNNRRH